MNKEHEKTGVKVSMLPFMIKAAVAALKKFPEFNARSTATSAGAEEVLPHRLRRRHAERPGGAGDPRRRQEDRARDRQGDGRARQAGARRQAQARPDAGRHLLDLSSLGGIGGTDFTPIINAPEVAILGVCKSYWKQRPSDGKSSSSRLMLPLSLSWDHRVIDGAAAARFNVHFANVLADMRRVLF